jgi:thiol-disulfide isomerase/thioredoxin
MVFGGTWCHDTQNLLPLFYKLIDKSGFPENQVYLIGVDRAKTTFKSLHKKFAILNVPTFIIIDKKGKEVGRVVEYGNTGAIDKELGQIVANIQ